MRTLVRTMLLGSMLAALSLGAGPATAQVEAKKSEP